MKRATGAIAVLAATFALGACHKAKPVETPAPTPPVQTRDTAAENAAARERMRQDSIARAEAARREAAAATASARAALQEMVFFDYDKAEIRGDMQDILNRKAAILRANPNVTLTIAGHADERGTVEYNLALSLRRANTVRDYLTGFGIDASRLEVTGYGEERPLEQGSSEEAYARNRRAEFSITRGGDTLVPAR
ncbi:MAG TPA: OmpA family protein [Longimicrobiales bacterium]